jgi:hypothetical protein
MNRLKITVAIMTLCSSVIAFASPRIGDLEKEGARDGKAFADLGRKNDIKIDSIYCSLGMMAEDRARPELSQVEIEKYVAAYGNACVGRKVL